MFERFKNKLQEAGDGSTECMLKKARGPEFDSIGPIQKSQVPPCLPVTLVLRRQRQEALEAFWTVNLTHTDIQDQ